MVSKSQIKYITSLSQKKYRQKQRAFVVEGIKGINEFLNSSFNLEYLFTEAGYFNEIASEKRTTVTIDHLKRISSLRTPQKALAVFKIPESFQTSSDSLQLLLDDVSDPGNLGTIIRLCDWFGLKNLYCSKTTVDCYNPKVVQATMGSLTRVQVHYVELSKFLAAAKKPIYGTFMEGENVYRADIPLEAILVMGNEANGISPATEALISKKISIPSFGQQQTESLNVATATAILLSEFKRR
ncbi:MAG: RNA methyltransferase [Leeuwenhoekiella sp.]